MDRHSTLTNCMHETIMPPAVTSDEAEADPVSDVSPRNPKRVKLSDGVVPPATLAVCQKLLETTNDAPVPLLPLTLVANGKTGNDIGKVRTIFDDHGFRTSIVVSPRSALSVYKDSCFLNGNNDIAETIAGKEFLIILLGMHLEQSSMENFYASSVKNVYCLLMFCHCLREACPEALKNQAVEQSVAANEELCRSLACRPHEMSGVAAMVPERVAQMIQHVIQVDPRIRVQQLEHEYERITLRNSTLSNAHVQLFLQAHDCVVQNIFLKRSHVTKYERFSISLYDSEFDLLKPPRFTFLPCLEMALTEGPEAIAAAMVDSFWSHLLRRGYFATKAIQSELTPDLEKYFLSGLSQDLTTPLQLNAHFTPVYSIAFYFQGKSGAGKSSLARNFSHALNTTVEEYVDPEILVRFVKQNLNKRLDVLQLELDLRPNNNDLSVMSIIQGRRMTMGQSKPGLVVVDMEEMASNRVGADPNQLQTAQLISQRFSGRNGDYKEGEAPRNSAKRGISGDATLIALFTSNYELEEPCKQALQKLEMFRNLKSIEMEAISGDDRRAFAFAYIQQCVKDRFDDWDITCKIDLDIPFGDGDTRPLVRHLRMLSFYLCTLVTDLMKVGGIVEATIVQKDNHCNVTVGNQSIELHVGTMENLLPTVPRIFDRRTSVAVEGLRCVLGDTIDYTELSVIIDFWLSNTLAPAVIVSQDRKKVKSVVAALGALYDMYHIPRVDAGEYKMMKSLYDPNDTPNLRDDILRLGRGAFVAVELKCETVDAQLCIREMIEDTPSMTAFSTEKSALYKSGLLFGVYVNGEITPEVMSRASLIL